MFLKHTSTALQSSESSISEEENSSEGLAGEVSKAVEVSSSEMGVAIALPAGDTPLLPAGNKFRYKILFDNEGLVDNEVIQVDTSIIYFCTDEIKWLKNIFDYIVTKSNIKDIKENVTLVEDSIAKFFLFDSFSDLPEGSIVAFKSIIENKITSQEEKYISLLSKFTIAHDNIKSNQIEFEVESKESDDDHDESKESNDDHDESSRIKFCHYSPEETDNLVSYRFIPLNEEEESNVLKAFNNERIIDRPFLNEQSIRRLNWSRKTIMASWLNDEVKIFA